MTPTRRTAVRSRREQCRHGWLTGLGPGACTAGCNPHPPGHKPTVHTTRAGTQVRCQCSWRSAWHRLVRGWVPGGRDVERGRAESEWADHIRPRRIAAGHAASRPSRPAS